MKMISKKTGIPYTTMIIIIGVIFGTFEDRMGNLGKAINLWSTMSPHMMMLVFLPALIFESAFNSDWHIFKIELG